MRRSRYTHRFFPLLCLGFATFLAFIVVLADTGQGQPYWSFLAGIPAGDKFGHFTLFGTLALLADLAAPAWRWKLSALSLPVGSMAVMIACAMEEISQCWIPTRTFDLLDLTADAIGITAGALAARWIRFHRMKHQANA